MRLFVYTLYIGYTLGRRRDTKRMPFRYAVRHVLVGVYIVSHVFLISRQHMMQGAGLA